MDTVRQYATVFSRRSLSEGERKLGRFEGQDKTRLDHRRNVATLLFSVRLEMLSTISSFFP